MSTRTHRVHTNTTQILGVLSQCPLSFRELAKRVREDDETLSQDVDKLVKDGVLAMRFHNHCVQYALKQHHSF